MRPQRDEQQMLRNKRRKQFRWRLQEQEWKRQRHLWRTGRRLFLEDLELEEEIEEK